MNIAELKQLLHQKIDVNNKIEKLGGFSQEQQVLFLIDTGFVTPKLLIEKLGIQKTNLSLICKNLLQKKLILKSKFSEDKKQIMYSINTKGKNRLTTKLKEMQELTH